MFRIKKGGSRFTTPKETLDEWTDVPSQVLRGHLVFRTFETAELSGKGHKKQPFFLEFCAIEQQGEQQRELVFLTTSRGFFLNAREHRPDAGAHHRTHLTTTTTAAASLLSARQTTTTTTTSAPSHAPVIPDMMQMLLADDLDGGTPYSDDMDMSVAGLTDDDDTRPLLRGADNSTRRHDTMNSLAKSTTAHDASGQAPLPLSTTTSALALTQPPSPTDNLSSMVISVHPKHGKEGCELIIVGSDSFPDGVFCMFGWYGVKCVFFCFFFCFFM